MREASLLPTDTEPWDGLSSRARTCINVLLPEPLLPTTATDSPAVIARFMSSRAANSASPFPYVLLTCLAAMTGTMHAPYLPSGELCYESHHGKHNRTNMKMEEMYWLNLTVIASPGSASSANRE